MKENQSSLPPALFIAGTDTGVGKTLIAACLLAYLHSHKIIAGYQKWVSTGSAEASEDEALCRRLAPDAFLSEPTMHVPYRFSLPASPHLAAEVDGRRVSADLLKQSFKELQKRFHTLVVEGVGGLLVPLTRKSLLVDFVEEMQLPVIVVCRSGLGTINHSLLSIEACRKRGIQIIGLIFSDEEPGLDELIVTDNMQIIAEIGGVEVLGRLPHTPSPEKAVSRFEPIGEAFMKSIVCSSQ